jgi:hypothetical protein
MNEKKTIELLVLPPPKTVGAQNGHENADKSKQSVSRAQPDTWWSAAELGKRGHKKDRGADDDGDDAVEQEKWEGQVDNEPKIRQSVQHKERHSGDRQQREENVLEN